MTTTASGRWPTTAESNAGSWRQRQPTIVACTVSAGGRLTSGRRLVSTDISCPRLASRSPICKACSPSPSSEGGNDGETIRTFMLSASRLVRFIAAARLSRRNHCRNWFEAAPASRQRGDRSAPACTFAMSRLARPTSTLWRLSKGMRHPAHARRRPHRSSAVIALELSPGRRA